MDFTTALQTAANAGAVSCMYAMIAVGLSLAFGVMGMANYAHGEFFMAGAYTVYAMYALGGNAILGSDSSRGRDSLLPWPGG